MATWATINLTQRPATLACCTPYQTSQIVIGPGFVSGLQTTATLFWACVWPTEAKRERAPWVDLGWTSSGPLVQPRRSASSAVAPVGPMPHALFVGPLL